MCVTAGRVPEGVHVAKAKVKPPMRVDVLVVDDDEHLRQGILAVLAHQEFGAHGVGSGHAALEMLRAGPEPRILLTDINMPRMTGIELAAAVQDEWPQIKVLLMTADGERAPRGVLMKPFTGPELIRRIRRRLRPR